MRRGDDHETDPLADIGRAYDRVKAGEVCLRAVIIPCPSRTFAAIIHAG